MEIIKNGWIYDISLISHTPATPTTYSRTPDGLEEDLGDEGEVEFEVMSITRDCAEADYSELLSIEDLELVVIEEKANESGC
jgi:hypothetical protein